MEDKIARAHRPGIGKGGLPLLGIALALAACSSASPRLYLLNAEQMQPNQHAELSGNLDPARPRASAALLPSIKAGISVTIPQYLDRPDILLRSDSNELASLSDARWAEDLSITASRVMAADLAAALPGADIVAWPARVDRTVNFRIAVDLTKFESDAHGNVEIEGRWTLLDERADTARASSHFRHTKTAEIVDAKTMVQTMSDLLAMTSAGIATELQARQFASSR